MLSQKGAVPPVLLAGGLALAPILPPPVPQISPAKNLFIIINIYYYYLLLFIIYYYLLLFIIIYYYLLLFIIIYQSLLLFIVL